MSKEKDTKKKGIKILILILIGAVLIFGNKDLQKKISKKIKIISNNKKILKIVDRKNIGYEENSNIRVYENSIVKWENALIIAYDMEGKEKWERAITYEKPLVCLGENRIYVGEGATGEIYCLDLDGNVVYKFEAKQPIDRIGERKNFLVLFIKNPQIEGINIIDEKGNLFANTTIKYGSVLNLDLNPDKSKFLLTTMDLSQGEITTNLSMYGSSGQILSTVEFKDQILTLINFVSEESAIILSNEGIYFMENNKILWEKNLPGLKDMYVDMDGKKIYLLYENVFEELSYDGKTRGKNELKEEYTSICPHGKYMILLGDSNILGINKGHEVIKYTTSDKIIDVFSNEPYLVVFTQDEMRIMNISNMK